MDNSLRCHILFSFRQGPWGGCNQFLSALREQLRKTGNWVDSPEMADVVLIDSFNDAIEAIRWKHRLPGTVFIHRVDGPVSIYRGKDRFVDRLIHQIGSRIADGVVFQSNYSMQANIRLGMPQPRHYCVINNAPSERYFWPSPIQVKEGRVRIIAVSWSAHPNKGFDVYAYLDRQLDFSKYAMTFVGNSPIAFKNIECIPPQDPAALGELLRKNNIYITASRHESCSNSLLEALACGLPAVAIRSGGNPEILGGGGVLFSGTEEVIDCIEQVARQLDHFRSQVQMRTISDVADAYLSFFKEVYVQETSPRRLTFWGTVNLHGRLLHRRGAAWFDRLAQFVIVACNWK